MMMNVSNFLLVSVIILIFVQSSCCESSRNLTKRSKVVEWKPYHCSLDTDGTFGTSLLHFVLDSDFLYFFFTEFVVRIKQIQVSYNYLRRFEEHDRENYFKIYEEPEYTRYDAMASRPDILGRNINVFFQVVNSDGAKISYAYEKVDSNDYMAYKIVFDRSVAG